MHLASPKTALPLVALASFVACGSTSVHPLPPPGVSLASITVTSRSFPANGPIPVDYTCDGKDLSPQLTWSSPPEGTKSLALVLEDPDAPGGTFTHWIVFNVPGDLSSIGEAVDPTCHSRDDGHERLPGHALPRALPAARRDAPLRLSPLRPQRAARSLQEGASRAALDTAMSGHVLGEGVLLATFGH